MLVYILSYIINGILQGKKGILTTLMSSYSLIIYYQINLLILEKIRCILTISLSLPTHRGTDKYRVWTYSAILECLSFSRWQNSRLNLGGFWIWTILSCLSIVNRDTCISTPSTLPPKNTQTSSRWIRTLATWTWMIYNHNIWKLWINYTLTPNHCKQIHTNTKWKNKKWDTSMHNA